VLSAVHSTPARTANSQLTPRIRLTADTSWTPGARACLTAGLASTALIQAADLVLGPDVLDPYYARFGQRWQARRTKGGAIRWHPLSARPAS